MSEAAAAKGKANDGDQGWKPRFNPWLIAISVTLAAFMEILDTTIVNVALPHIAGELSVSNDEATWTLTSYLVANGIVLTISGWLGDVLGRKRYFLICLAMFTVCSFLCGISQSLGQLIIFRMLQGFFGGGLQPNQQSIILDSFPPAGRAAAFGVSAIAIVVAPILGPTLGGLITDNASWRWVFYINVPIGIFAVVINYIVVEDPPWLNTKRSKSIDFIGLGLITVGLGCLQVMMDRGEDADWFGSPFIITMAILALLGIGGAVLWLLVAKNPIIHLEVFADKNFTSGCLLIAAMGAILYASAVLIPQLAQQVLSYTSTWSGLILSPGGVVVILLIPIVGQLMRIIPTKYVIAFGFFAMGCAFVYSSGIAPNINFDTLVLMRSAQSAALAFLFVPISTVTYMTIPRRLQGDASALFSMFRNVFGSIGISLSTAMVTEYSQVRQSYLSADASPLNQGYQRAIASYTHALQAMGGTHGANQTGAVSQLYKVYREQVQVLAYSDVFLLLAVLAFAVVPLCFLLSGKKASGGAAPSH
jgi:DHA2 family multidrug resistance protein